MEISDLDILMEDFALPGDEFITADSEAGQTSEKYKGDAKLFLERNRVYRRENIKKTTYKYISNSSDIPIPSRGEQIRIRTQQQMNLIVIILKLVDIHGVIDELTIATYTLNREAMSILTQLKSAGKIGKINLLIASSYGFRDPKWKGEMEQICKDNEMHLTFAWCHFKITLAKCGDDYYQFEGSMNYSTNNMAEQISFENNQEIYDWDYEFINGVMKDRNNKALEVIC